MKKIPALNDPNVAQFTLVSITLPAFRCCHCDRLVSSTMHRCGNEKYDIVDKDTLERDNEDS